MHEKPAHMEFAETLLGTAGPGRVAGIARQLAEVEGLAAAMDLIVDLSVGYLEHCDGATIMFVERGGRIATPAATDESARRADVAQHELGEGPCLSALREHELVVVGDLSAEARWPRWQAEVLEPGWRSMVGLRLFLADDTMGALNLYSRRPDGFPTGSQDLGQAFAAVAAVAMKSAISTEGLERALQARDEIGQAKGIVMERERISGDEAFTRLRELSNRRDLRMRDLAREVIETGDLSD